VWRVAMSGVWTAGIGTATSVLARCDGDFEELEASAMIRITMAVIPRRFKRRCMAFWPSSRQCAVYLLPWVRLPLAKASGLGLNLCSLHSASARTRPPYAADHFAWSPSP